MLSPAVLPCCRAHVCVRTAGGCSQRHLHCGTHGSNLRTRLSARQGSSSGYCVEVLCTVCLSKVLRGAREEEASAPPQVLWADSALAALVRKPPSVPPSLQTHAKVQHAFALRSACTAGRRAPTAVVAPQCVPGVVSDGCWPRWPVRLLLGHSVGRTRPTGLLRAWLGTLLVAVAAKPVSAWPLCPQWPAGAAWRPW